LFLPTKYVLMAALLWASARQGQYAPDFSLASSDGSVVSLANFRGRLVYLTFVDPGCFPCRQEIPALNAVARKYTETLMVLGVSLSAKSQADAARAKKEMGIEFPLLFDPSGSVFKTYQVYAIPKGFLVSEKGAVIKIYTGFVEELFLKDVGRESERLARLKKNCAVFLSPFLDATEAAAAGGLGNFYQGLMVKYLVQNGYAQAGSKAEARLVLNGLVWKENKLAGMTVYLDDNLTGKTVAVEDVRFPADDFQKFCAAVEKDLESFCASRPEAPGSRK
jgi:peroxiredoxin